MPRVGCEQDCPGLPRPTFNSTNVDIQPAKRAGLAVRWADQGSSVIESSLSTQNCGRHASCVAHNCAFHMPRDFSGRSPEELSIWTPFCPFVRFGTHNAAGLASAVFGSRLPSNRLAYRCCRAGEPSRPCGQHRVGQLGDRTRQDDGAGVLIVKPSSRQCRTIHSAHGTRRTASPDRKADDCEPGAISVGPECASATPRHLAVRYDYD
jgi:hypothetical protein